MTYLTVCHTAAAQVDYSVTVYPPLPPQTTLDLVFIVDCTGSYYGTLPTLKALAPQIVGNVSQFVPLISGVPREQSPLNVCSPPAAAPPSPPVPWRLVGISLFVPPISRVPREQSPLAWLLHPTGPPNLSPLSSF